MFFRSTKNIYLNDMPKGQVLVQYLEPSFGMWSVEFAIGYFDNPMYYENDNQATGWKLWHNDRQINVIAFCLLPEEKFKTNLTDLTQLQFKDKFKDWHPYSGNAGDLE